MASKTGTLKSVTRTPPGHTLAKGIDPAYDYPEMIWRTMLGRPTAFLATMSILYCAGASALAASGGGLPFDAHKCPKGDWWPDQTIPQKETDVVCQFLAALDRNDLDRAYGLFSDDLKANTPITVFKSHVQEQTGGRDKHPPERLIIDVQETPTSPNVHRLSFQVYTSRVGYRQDLYVTITPSRREGAEIVGMRLGPG